MLKFQIENKTEKDNQDIPLLHGYGYEYRKLVEKPKVKENKRNNE